MKTVKILFVCLLLSPLMSLLHAETYRGTVIDGSNKETLIGAAVKVRGNAAATITDMDGKFTLEATPGSIIEVSYIGFDPLTYTLGKDREVLLKMSVNNTQLNEVVVVGYGTQKSKDLTAPIAVVKGDALSKQLTSSTTQALQGKVAGVQVIGDGKPGSGGTVKIRGVGSIGDYAKPLYIVDGVFVDNIDFVSPSDIEDLTILKDASSAAIYGVRAANGVVLITTKKGTSDRAQVSYDGYAAVQVPVNIMKLATRDQYVDLINEANANTSGYVPKDVNNYPTSTDWYGELVKPAAMMQSHNLDVSGVTGNSNYSFGLNHFYQDGVMNVPNSYSRFNIRGRMETKALSWLKLGMSSIVSQAKSENGNTDAFFQAFVNPPVYPVYDDRNTMAYPVNFGSPQMYGYSNSYGNPVARAYYSENIDHITKVVMNAFAELTFIPNKLTFRTSYNQDLTFLRNRAYSPEYLVGGSQQLGKSTLSKNQRQNSKQIIDNLLTWRDQIQKHNYSVMVGQSTRMEYEQLLKGSGLGAPGDEEGKYLENTSIKGRDTGDEGLRYNGVSAFMRGTYNYDNRYLATFTFRADASSKYQQKWGYFPSLGLGWNITNESFMQSQKAFDYIKLRAAWGMLGNDNIPANSSITLGTTGAGSSGIFGDELVDGQGAQTVVQNYLKWEVVSELDLGVDFATLQNRLTGEFDYYRRVTDNVVFKAPIASGGGTAELLGNNGSILNTGLEFSLRWSDKVGDFNYNVGLNATTIHNEVLALNGKDYIPGASVRGNYTTRTAVGHPIGAFYGYQIDGVYQSEREALNDPIQQPIKDKGYFRYKDLDGNGKIDEQDKTFLGSPIPFLIGGIDFGATYKNWDFSLALQAQAGNKILNAKRMNRDVFVDGNYDLDFYQNSFRPDRPSNVYPSAEAYNSGVTQQANTFFVEDGSYIRLQNVTCGYTFKFNKYVQSLRVYASAQNPFTFFTYNGFSPEIGGDPISSGIDNSVYPRTGTYSLGVKINF